jgi:hypothetical protein
MQITITTTLLETNLRMCEFVHIKKDGWVVEVDYLWPLALHPWSGFVSR